MKEIDEKSILELQKNADELKTIKADDKKIEIDIDTVRWIGNGSGKINLESGSVRFYIENGRIVYVTDSHELVRFFERLGLDLRIKKLMETQECINSIMNSYYQS